MDPDYGKEGRRRYEPQKQVHSRTTKGVSSLTPIKIVLCDMDDTIVVHRPYADQLWREVVGALSIFSASVRDALAEAIVSMRHKFWQDENLSEWGRLRMREARRYFVLQAFDVLGVDKDDEVIDVLVDEFSRLREESLLFPPENAVALQILKEAGVALALVSNGQGDAQRTKVNRFHLDNFFDAIFIEGEIGVGKPDWEIYRMVLGRFGCEPTDAVMVGDNWEWEVAAPISYQMRAIWIHSDDATPPLPVSGSFLGRVSSFAKVPELLAAANVMP